MFLGIVLVHRARTDILYRAFHQDRNTQLCLVVPEGPQCLNIALGLPQSVHGIP